MEWAKSPAGRFQLFPYREEQRYRTPDGKIVPVFRPTLNLTVEYGDMDWTVRAVIDTGAPVTIFDRGTADALAIDFDKRPRRVERHSIGGRKHDAQVERVTLRLAPFHDLTWEAEVGFLIDDWNMPFGGLLGSQGFLDQWVVTFSAGENYFIVEEPESFAGRLPPDMAKEFERGGESSGP